MPQPQADDPFSQKDYFRLLAFFANTDYEAGRLSDDALRRGATGSGHARTRSRTQERTDRDRQPRADAEDHDDGSARRAGAMGRHARAERTWTPLPLVRAEATNGVTLSPLPDGSVLASGPNPTPTSYTVTVETQQVGITGLRIEALPDQSLPRNGPGRDG